MARTAIENEFQAMLQVLRHRTTSATRASNLSQTKALARVPGIRLQRAHYSTAAMEMAMITGMHAVVYTRDAEADRAFFRDVLGFSSVDAGGGWLIFAAPPSELACHPAESNGKHELYLMCDDLRAEIARLGEKGIACGPVSDQE